MFSEITLINYDRPLAQRAKARKSVGPYKWRPNGERGSVGFYTGQGGVMDKHGSPLSLRIEDANDHLLHSRLSHIDGYYCDANGDGDTLQPIVARLPKGRGFLAGWTMGAGMCAVLDRDIWPDEIGAANEAHRMAQRDADDMRSEVTSEEGE